MSKNIVIFSDGTGQEGGRGNNTNVYNLFNMIEDRTDRQISFYDPGLGTGKGPIGLISGIGISKNIKQCYRFLTEHFKSGDQIYLFGFSRGATTVRTLSGFIYLFGILPRSRPELIDEAWRIYKIKNRHKRSESADAFVRRNSTMWTSIRFLGVWDTVAALGLPIKRLDVIIDNIPAFSHSFHDLRLSKSVEYARHALAIDDERKTFHPKLWDERGTKDSIDAEKNVRPFIVEDIRDIYLVADKLKARKEFTSKKIKANKHLNEEEHPVSSQIKLSEKTTKKLRKFNSNGKREESTHTIECLKQAVINDFNAAVRCEKMIFDPEKINDIERLALSKTTKERIRALDPSSNAYLEDVLLVNTLLIEETYNLMPAHKPKIKQVWFAGMHTDVGGGYREYRLAHIPLVWMTLEAMDLGLHIYKKHKVSLCPDCNGKMHDSRAGIGRFYQQLERYWDRERNQGLSPIVHESVSIREKSHNFYEPWILKTDHKTEPFLGRQTGSIQFDDYHIWRESFWGWDSAFSVSWEDIKRVSYDEQKGTILLQMKDHVERADIVISGSLPKTVSTLISQLEVRLESRRQKVANELLKEQDEKMVEMIALLNKQDEKQQEIIKELESKVEKMEVDQYKMEFDLYKEQDLDSANELEEKLKKLKKKVRK